jgi:hypothetical protein
MDRKFLISMPLLAVIGMASATDVSTAMAQTAPTNAATCADGSGPTSGFFCAPRAQGNPVRACSAGGLNAASLTTCRQTTADSFCRTVSFSRAAAFQVNSTGALAEVTCTGRQAQTAMAVPATAKAASTVAPTTAQAPATSEPPVAQQDYVYATGHTTPDGSVTFRPTFQVSAFGSEMTGFTTITNPRADFDSFYQGGMGAYTATRYDGTFSNNVFKGIWRENEDEQGLSYVQTTCDRADGGTLVWGQFEIRFTPDRRSFVGTMTLCDRAVADANSWDKNSWKGTLTGRAEASVATPKGSSPTAAGSRSSSSSSSRSTQGTSQSSQPREETVADRIAREAAAAAEQRAKDEARQGVNRAIDGLIKRRP